MDKPNYMYKYSAVTFRNFKVFSISPSLTSYANEMKVII